MIQLLRLLCGTLIGLLRSSARREAEILVLRRQINVLRRSAFRTVNCHAAENKLQIQRHANLIALGRRLKLCPPPLALALLLTPPSEPNGVTVAEFWSI